MGVEREQVHGHGTATDPATGERFLFFWTTESPFSQWHPSPLLYRGTRFSTAEQWMMSMKAFVFGDEEALGKILATSSAKLQKQLGREVVGFDTARWTECAEKIVYLGSWLKWGAGALVDPAAFSEADRLLLGMTDGYTLVEASPLDRIWGIGLSEHAEEAASRSRWRGENRLGRILTELRSELARGAAEARATGYFDALGLAAFPWGPRPPSIAPRPPSLPPR